MGRPSIKNKRAKRKKQKMQRKKNPERLSPAINACSSPLLFSNDSETPCTVVNDADQTATHTDSQFSGALGDADTDLIEMDLYDQCNIEVDGELHSMEYIYTCRKVTINCEQKLWRIVLPKIGYNGKT